MPESFIPVWMSIGEAEEFRRFLQEEARSTDGEFPEREFDLIDSALRDERPRTFEELESVRSQQDSTEEGEPVSADEVRGILKGRETAGENAELMAARLRPLLQGVDLDAAVNVSVAAQNVAEVIDLLEQFAPQQHSTEEAGPARDGLHRTCLQVIENGISAAEKLSARGDPQRYLLNDWLPLRYLLNDWLPFARSVLNEAKDAPGSTEEGR